MPCGDVYSAYGRRVSVSHWRFYTFLREASAVARSTNRVMRRPLMIGTGNRYGSHALLFITCWKRGLSDKLANHNSHYEKFVLGSFMIILSFWIELNLLYSLVYYHSNIVYLNDKMLVPKFKWLLIIIKYATIQKRFDMYAKT